MHGGQTWKALVKNPFSVLQIAPVEFAVSWMKIVIQRENRSGRVVIDSLIYKAQERGISPAGVCFIGIGIAIGIERIKSTDCDMYTQIKRLMPFRFYCPTEPKNGSFFDPDPGT
jgi:hypothetical protein